MINTMRKIFIIFSFLLFLCGAVYSQSSPSKKVSTKDSPTGSDFTRETVETFCRNLTAELEENQKNYKKQSYLSYSLHHKTIERWLNYQFLELDSEINLSWFRKLDEFIQFFYNTKRSYDKSSEAETSETKTLSKKRFDAGLENFKKFLEKDPPKPPAQRLEMLKRQKQEYLRTKKAQERKQSGNTRKLFDDN
jgi:hypothetical protein